MNDLLTESRFERWRTEEFQPHIQAEEAYEQKVDKLDADLSKWLKVVSVGIALISVIGGAALTMFFWVLLEKNAQIMLMQRDLQLIAQTQQGVLNRLESHARELKTRSDADVEIIRMLIEQYKRQANGEKRR